MRLLVLVVLLTTLVPVRVTGTRTGSGHIYYSTADPLGVAYRNLATGKEKRLFIDPVWALSPGPHSWVAALRDGRRIEVFRDGKLIRALDLRPADNRLVGWTDRALVYRVPDGLRALDVSQGGSRPLRAIGELVAAHPVVGGWVGVTHSDDELGVGLYQSIGRPPVHTWQTQFADRFWDSSIIGGTHLIAWGKDYSDRGEFIKDRLLVFDLVQRRQWTVQSEGACRGIASGRSNAELLIASRVVGKRRAGSIQVDAVNLVNRSRRTLATIDIGDAELVGPTADAEWLIMYMVYPDSGPGHPGKVFAVRITDGYRKTVRENVYEVVPPPASGAGAAQ